MQKVQDTGKSFMTENKGVKKRGKNIAYMSKILDFSGAIKLLRLFEEVILVSNS